MTSARFKHEIGQFFVSASFFTGKDAHVIEMLMGENAGQAGATRNINLYLLQVQSHH
jgi:hypothetical protein